LGLIKKHILAGSMNTIDVTGYVQKARKQSYARFSLFEDGQKAFAAKPIVEYFNG
jgi:hypothetical protein